MSVKPSLEYVGRAIGNVKKSTNVHTVKAEELMIPKPVVSQESVLSFKVNLD